MTSLKYTLIALIWLSMSEITFSQEIIGPLPEGQTVQEEADSGEFIGHGFVLAVNGDAISSYDIIEKTKAKLIELSDKDYRSFYMAAGEIIQTETLREVYDLLMYQYAYEDLQKNDNGEEILQAARERQRKNIVRQYAGNEAVAYLELEKMGITMDEMLDRFQRRLVVQNYKDVVQSSDRTISRLEIIDYYNQHIDQYSIDAEMQFSLIQVDSKVKAQDILSKLADGDDFAELAKAESDGWRAKYGGLWEPLNPDSIRKQYKPIIAELIKLEPDQLTGIIESEGKFFIALLNSYSPQRPMKLAEVQDKIRNEINELRWQEYTGKLEKKLMERAVIGDVNNFVAGTVFTAWKKFGDQKE